MSRTMRKYMFSPSDRLPGPSPFGHKGRVIRPAEVPDNLFGCSAGTRAALKKIRRAKRRAERKAAIREAIAEMADE